MRICCFNKSSLTLVKFQTLKAIPSTGRNSSRGFNLAFRNPGTGAKCSGKRERNGLWVEIAVAGIRVGVWGHTRIIQQQNRWLQVRGRCSAFTGATLASSLLRAAEAGRWPQAWEGLQAALAAPFEGDNNHDNSLSANSP